MLLPHLPGAEVLAALGEISVRHGYLDLVLRRTIKTLSGVSIGEVDKALARTGAGEMQGMIDRLAKRRLRKEHPAVLRLKAILSDCERVTERRNQLTHAPWAKFLDGEAVLYRATGETLKMPTMVELKALADEIHALATSLNAERLGGFIAEALLDADGSAAIRDAKIPD
jgi:DNA-binding transcriptional MerR regulator